jgi:hypothetical protein
VLSFRATVRGFLGVLAQCLFEYTRDFWKTFVCRLAELLACEGGEILTAIDE